jgi:hypothetical protein
LDQVFSHLTFLSAALPMTTRSRIFLTYTLFLLIPLLLTLGTGGYLFADRQAEALQQQAQALADAVGQQALTASKTALEHNLRTLADNNQQLFAALYEKYRAGSLSQDEAQWLALEGLVAQRIAPKGILFCIDSQGLILAHPNKALAHTHLDVDLLSRLRTNAPGTITTFQQGAQPATLYTKVDFPPWNLTIVASFPMADLPRFLTPQQLAQAVDHLPHNTSAHPFFLDASGIFWLPDPASLGTPEQKQQLAAQILQLVNQQHNPQPLNQEADTRHTDQTLFFRPLAELDLIAGVIIPTAEFNQPFTQFYRACLLLLLPVTLLALGAIFLLAQRLSRPYAHLATALSTSLHQPSPTLPQLAADISTIDVSALPMPLAKCLLHCTASSNCSSKNRRPIRPFSNDCTRRSPPDAKRSTGSRRKTALARVRKPISFCLKIFLTALLKASTSPTRPAISSPPTRLSPESPAINPQR